MTPEQKKNYISSGGNECPKCGSSEISPIYGFETDGTSAWRAVECDECGKRWNDVYKLIDIEEIQD